MPREITDQWNRKYDTNPNAGPTEHRVVANALAIRITKGSLRSSEFDGVFELADVPKPFDLHDGKLRVEVMVGWFGMKPKTTWSHVTLSGDWELLRNWSGKVVHNLSDENQSNASK
jgi:hypothetical protein